MTEWPAWDEFDHRFGFPLRRDIAERIAAMSEEDQAEALKRLAAATFETLAKADLALLYSDPSLARRETAGGPKPRRPARRTITLFYGKPWLFGWARWEIATDLYFEGGGIAREVLSAGRWKWRGRHADAFEATVECDVFFAGPPR